MIDLHCHILPGLDDGARTMAEALAMARIAADDGVRAVIATPHHGDGLHSNPAGKVLERLRAFRQALRANAIPLKAAAGAEVRLQPNILDMVKRGETLMFGKTGRILLLELPARTRLTDVAQTLFQLRLIGVTPIIAHVERLYDAQEDVERLAPLIRMGVLTQVTAGVLLTPGQEPGPIQGQEPAQKPEELAPRAKECALRLLRRGYVHFLASDGHRAKGRGPTLRQGFEAAARAMGDERRARALVIDNPLRILRGDALRIPPPPSAFARGARAARGWFGRDGRAT